MLRIIAAVMMTAFFIVPGQAQTIERTCKAYYKIKNPYRQDRVFGHFYGVGLCDGSEPKANLACRQAAKERAIKCMQIHWTGNNKVIPNECKGIYKVRQYNAKNPHCWALRKSCEVHKGLNFHNKTMDVYAVTTGKPGCNGETLLKSRFGNEGTLVDCEKLSKSLCKAFKLNAGK